MTTPFDAWCFLVAVALFALAIFHVPARFTRTAAALAKVNLLAAGLTAFALPFALAALPFALAAWPHH